MNLTKQALRRELKFADKVSKIPLIGDAPPCSRPLSSFTVERFLHSFQQPTSLRLLGTRGLASFKLLRPYAFHITLALYWPILLYADTQIQTLTQQRALGLLTFAFLLVAMRFSPRTERRQVWLMVAPLRKACWSSSSLVMCMAPLRTTKLRLVLIRPAPSRTLGEKSAISGCREGSSNSDETSRNSLECVYWTTLLGPL
jgi:hypothetical protein